MLFCSAGGMWHGSVCFCLLLRFGVKSFGVKSAGKKNDSSSSLPKTVGIHLPRSNIFPKSKKFFLFCFFCFPSREADLGLHTDGVLFMSLIAFALLNSDFSVLVKLSHFEEWAVSIIYLCSSDSTPTTTHPQIILRITN